MSTQLHFFKVFNKHHYDVILAETEEAAKVEYAEKNKEPIESLSCEYANTVEREEYCFRQTKAYESIKNDRQLRK